MMQKFNIGPVLLCILLLLFVTLTVGCQSNSVVSTDNATSQETNPNVPNELQAFVTIMTTLAGFTATILTLFIGQSAIEQKHESDEKIFDRKPLRNRAIMAFIATFVFNFLGAVISATGSGEVPITSERALVVFLAPSFLMVMSFAYLLIGIIFVLEFYGFEEPLGLMRYTYYAFVFIGLFSFAGAVDDATSPPETSNQLLFLIFSLIFLLIATILARNIGFIKLTDFRRFCIFCGLVAVFFFVFKEFVQVVYDSGDITPVWFGFMLLAINSIVLGGSLVFVIPTKEPTAAPLNMTGD